MSSTRKETDLIMLVTSDIAGQLRGKAMTYDAENRPLSVTFQGSTTTYIYGADGSRLFVDSGGTRTATFANNDGELYGLGFIRRLALNAAAHSQLYKDKSRKNDGSHIVGNRSGIYVKIRENSDSVRRIETEEEFWSCVIKCRKKLKKA